MIRKFKSSRYVTSNYATHNLTTGARLESPEGELMGNPVHMGRSGTTQGFASIRPYPLDIRGCFVRIESDGEVLIVWGPDLVDTYCGPAAEIADWLDSQAAKLTAEDCTPTRAPRYEAGETHADWLASGELRRLDNMALIRERAALIRSVAVAIIA